MKFFGYTLNNSDEKPEVLLETCIECTVEEIDCLINSLSEERKKIIEWATSYDMPANVFPGDVHEIQAKTTVKGERLVFLIDLYDAIKKYHNTEDSSLSDD